MKKLILVLGAGLVLAFGVACSGNLDEIDAVAADHVMVDDNTFEARVIEVEPGTTVTWTWAGSRPHDVAGEGWASDIQSEGEFQHTFEAPGAYDYKCTLHGGMTGRVIVTQ